MGGALTSAAPIPQDVPGLDFVGLACLYLALRNTDSARAVP